MNPYQPTTHTRSPIRSKRVQQRRNERLAGWVLGGLLVAYFGFGVVLWLLGYRA